MEVAVAVSVSPKELKLIPHLLIISSEEHVPLSSRRSSFAALSTGFLVDTNLDTSVPDAYRPPPPTVPFDMALGRSETRQGTTNSGSIQETTDIPTRETSAKCEDVKESDFKKQAKSELDSSKEPEVELSELVKPFVSATEEEEDVCPVCLVEYDAENPKVTTKCEHHFHLACILEWLERSETCPVCDKEVRIEPPID